MDTGMLAEIFGPDGIIVIVVLAVVLLFGGRKLPELARGLGSASREFKKGIDEGHSEEAVAMPEGTKSSSPSTR
jgi:sec-independent protein translocase protein TatA